MLPLFLPGLAISVVVGLAAADPVGRALAVGRATAWVLVVSLGIILAATLTPLAGAMEAEARGPGYCDFSRIWVAPWEQLLSTSDASGNVLMFIPLGVAIGLVPRSRRKTAIVVGAIALPFAIEITQSLVPWMDRACESADVVDNLTGLALGLVGGVAAGRIAHRADRRPG
jgi:glycopeptide antibiotics resistance protein